MVKGLGECKSGFGADKENLGFVATEFNKVVSEQGFNFSKAVRVRLEGVIELGVICITKKVNSRFLKDVTQR